MKNIKRILSAVMAFAIVLTVSSGIASAACISGNQLSQSISDALLSAAKNAPSVKSIKSTCSKNKTVKVYIKNANCKNAKVSVVNSKNKTLPATIKSVSKNCVTLKCSGLKKGEKCTVKLSGVKTSKTNCNK